MENNIKHNFIMVTSIPHKTKKLTFIDSEWLCECKKVFYSKEEISNHIKKLTGNKKMESATKEDIKSYLFAITYSKYMNDNNYYLAELEVEEMYESRNHPMLIGKSIEEAYKIIAKVK